MKKAMFFRLPKNYCFALIILIAATTPRLALAVPPVGGPYLGVEGGATWLNNQTLPNNRGKDEFHNWFSPGYLGGIVAGYSFSNGLRPELELSFLRSELDQSQYPAISGVSTESASGSESAAAAMGNLWYDYRLGNGILGKIHPYMGIGIGIARIGIRHFSIPNLTGANDINAYRSTWVYQLGAGFYADITRHWVASIDWRWLQTPHFNVHSTLSTGEVRSRYQSESLILSVRYVFGSTKVISQKPARLVQAAAPPPAPVCNPPQGFKVDSNCNIINQTVILRSVNFRFNSAQLTKPATETLRKISRVIARYRTLKAVIVGYTDSVGAVAYNVKLSLNRANAVRAYLIHHGVNPKTLTARGSGEANPVASNKTAIGRAENRRVEFDVTDMPNHVKVIQKRPLRASVDAALRHRPVGR